MKKVVITGASGFIGQALTKYFLNKTIEVYAIVRKGEQLRNFQDNEYLHTVEIELEDYLRFDKWDGIPEVDAFFHLAWAGHMGQTFGIAFQNYRLQMENASYTGDAISAAIYLKAKKFVMASTINVIEAMDYFGKSNIKPRYTCIYEVAKLSAEMICQTIAFQKGIEINIALIANSYGPGDSSKTIPNVLISNLLKGKSPDLVEGNFLYDWVYIEDIVKGLYAIAEKGKNQKSYYIGHEKLETFKEIALQVRDILNPDVKLKFGVYPDAMALDYNKVDRQELFCDTGYRVNSDFKESILKTAEWIKSLNWEI